MGQQLVSKCFICIKSFVVQDGITVIIRPCICLMIKSSLKLFTDYLFQFNFLLSEWHLNKWRPLFFSFPLMK